VLDPEVAAPVHEWQFDRVNVRQLGDRGPNRPTSSMLSPPLHHHCGLSQRASSIDVSLLLTPWVPPDNPAADETERRGAVDQRVQPDRRSASGSGSRCRGGRAD
jgi:hypothetical protein